MQDPGENISGRAQQGQYGIHFSGSAEGHPSCETSGPPQLQPHRPVELTSQVRHVYIGHNQHLGLSDGSRIHTGHASHTETFSNISQGEIEVKSEMAGSDAGSPAVGIFAAPQPAGSQSQTIDEESAGPSQSAHAPSQPMKKTKGRVKIKMEYIDNKLRRYTTFSKRKTGIMKKAYELSTLTGTQVMLLVASETGHVYTFATRKLQPMITSEAGKGLIQTCLNSPEPGEPAGQERMSAAGFEETELGCAADDDAKDGDADSVSDRSDAGSSPVPRDAHDSSLVPREAHDSSLVPREAHVDSSLVPREAHDSSLVPREVYAGFRTRYGAARASAPHQVPVISERHWSPDRGADNPTDARQRQHSDDTLLPLVPPVCPLSEGLALLNSPASVIQRVASEHAGEAPHAAQPTDLSKSRVPVQSS